MYIIYACVWGWLKQCHSSSHRLMSKFGKVLIFESIDVHTYGGTFHLENERRLQAEARKNTCEKAKDRISPLLALGFCWNCFRFSQQSWLKAVEDGTDREYRPTAPSAPPWPGALVFFIVFSGSIFALCNLASIFPPKSFCWAWRRLKKPWQKHHLQGFPANWQVHFLIRSCPFTKHFYIWQHHLFSFVLWTSCFFKLMQNQP